ncbi:MAG: insulinase family protein [Clostridia bacterium]|nr:insulinase family protein [Clostridia bacterium]
MSAIREHILPNGMTILCWHQPHLHGLEFGLYLKGGPLYETEDVQGVCHLIEHLCFRNLGGLHHDALQQSLNRFGSELRGATYPEAIVFRLMALPRFFDGMLEIFTRFFADTPWTPAEIGKEKQVVLRQIEQEEADFEEAVDQAWRQTLNGVFPVMGTAQSLEALDEDTIHNWRRLIFQPCNACLVIAGNFSNGMEAAAVEAFSELHNYTNEAPFEQPLPLGFCMRDESSDTVSDEEDGQAEVHIAFDIDEESVYPLLAEVLSAITGGNCDSLLFQALREDEALVAEIESYIQEMGAFHRLVIRYSVRQERLVESLCKVFMYLHRLRMYVRPIRLNAVRTQFTANNALLTDSVSELCELAGWAWVAGDASRADLDAKARVFSDLTAEELLDAAQTIFRPENLCISIQRDPNIVMGDLAPLLRELRQML